VKTLRRKTGKRTRRNRGRRRTGSGRGRKGRARRERERCPARGIREIERRGRDVGGGGIWRMWRQKNAKNQRRVYLYFFLAFVRAGVHSCSVQLTPNIQPWTWSASNLNLLSIDIIIKSSLVLFIVLRLRRCGLSSVHPFLKSSFSAAQFQYYCTVAVIGFLYKGNGRGFFVWGLKEDIVLED